VLGADHLLLGSRGDEPDSFVNTIVADNVIGNDGVTNPVDADCFVTNPQFGGLNLIEDGSCGAAAAGQLTGDPTLGSLADYGGPTPYQPLLARSVAIDQVGFVPNAGCGATSVMNDQRGTARPQPTPGGCDLGAVEYTGFPANPVLDNFNRDDGAVGSTWSGNRDAGSYRVVGNHVKVRNGGPLYWISDVYGVDQEAYVTFTMIDPSAHEETILLKVQGDPANYTLGEIEIVYDSSAHTVNVATLLPGASDWTLYPTTSLTLKDGDQLGARAYADGSVNVYRNGAPVAVVTLKPKDQKFFNAKGGRIGVWFDTAPQATFDSFGGGTIIKP
jgi:hypothetical protein